jgi:CHAT domain-containing protein
MARVGLHESQVNSAFASLLLASIIVIFSCSPGQQSNVATGNPEAAFARIRTESQRGNFLRARSDAQQYFAAWQSRPAAKWHWKFRLLDAEMLLFNGETRQASALLRSPPPHADLLPRFQMLQGYVAFREGRESDAQALLARAASKARDFSDYELEADSQLLLAAYASPADAERTEKIIDGILEIGKAHNLHYQVAAALVDLGLLRIHQSRFAAAIPLFEQASESAKRSDATLLYSIALGNLATCYYSLGDFDKAMELRKDAVAIQEPAGLTTPLRDSYLELGSSQLLQDNTREAIGSLRHALALASAEDTPEIYSLIACNLAAALESTGALDEAERLNRSATAANKGQDSEAKTALLLNQAAIAEHRGQHQAAVNTYLKALSASKGNPSLEWSAHAALASIYARENYPARGRLDLAGRHFESALRTIEASRAEQLQSKYKITFLSHLIRFYQEYVAFLMREGDAAKALRVADSSRASVLTQDVTGLNGRENRDLIPRIQNEARRTRTAFLFYFLAPKQSYLWIVSGHELKTAQLPDEQEIAEQVRSYRYLLEEEKVDPLRSTSALPVRLFQSLIGPALPWISPNSAVVIVPDGALHRLNFETLVVKTPTPHYWIQDVTLSIAPSLDILTLAEGNKKTKHRSLLLIGDPKPASDGFPQLPHAGAEMAQVRSHFAASETSVLRGAGAVPAAYGASQPQRFSTLHIAAHAETNERSPLDSAIILSPQADGYRLYAREIMGIPLTSELVTLSACRSAGARTLSGEGPVGFAWAFFQAGAQNVVASLWDVNDRSTADLMDLFYTAIDNGESYPTALRQAKLKMLETRFQKPYYWAPFQLYSRSVPAASASSGHHKKAWPEEVTASGHAR